MNYIDSVRCKQFGLNYRNLLKNKKKNKSKWTSMQPAGTVTTKVSLDAK